MWKLSWESAVLATLYKVAKAGAKEIVCPSITTNLGMGAVYTGMFGDRSFPNKT